MTSFGERGFDIQEFVTPFEQGMEYERQNNERKSIGHFSKDASQIKKELGRYAKSIYGYYDMPQLIADLPTKGEEIITKFYQSYVTSIKKSQALEIPINLNFEKNETELISGLKMFLITINKHQKEMDIYSKMLDPVVLEQNLLTLGYKLKNTEQLERLWSYQKFKFGWQQTEIGSLQLVSLIICVRSILSNLLMSNLKRDVFMGNVSQSIIETNLKLLNSNRSEYGLGTFTYNYFKKRNINLDQFINVIQFIFSKLNSREETVENSEIRAGIYSIFSVLPGLASTYNNYS